jgi:hypothetical protein
VAAPENTSILNYLLTGGGAVVLTQIGNMVANRKQRTAEPAKMLVEGSVSWAKQLAEDAREAAERAERVEERYDDLWRKYVDLRDKYDGLERRMDRQQQANSKHTQWDEDLMAKLREVGIDFPDPPSLEVA